MQDGLDDPPLATDDLAGIFFVHANFDENRTVLGIARRDLQIVGKLDERAHDGLDETDDVFRLLGHDAYAFSRARFSRLATVSVGWAPFLIHWSTFSRSNCTMAGSVQGL